MNFSVYIKIFRLVIEEDFGIFCFGHFGRFMANDDELAIEGEHEGEWDNGNHQKNSLVFY